MKYRYYIVPVATLFFFWTITALANNFEPEEKISDRITAEQDSKPWKDLAPKSFIKNHYWQPLIFGDKGDPIIEKNVEHEKYENIVLLAKTFVSEWGLDLNKGLFPDKYNYMKNPYKININVRENFFVVSFIPQVHSILKKVPYEILVGIKKRDLHLLSISVFMNDESNTGEPN